MIDVLTTLYGENKTVSSEDVQDYLKPLGTLVIKSIKLQKGDWRGENFALQCEGFKIVFSPSLLSSRLYDDSRTEQNVRDILSDAIRCHKDNAKNAISIILNNRKQQITIRRDHARVVHQANYFGGTKLYVKNRDRKWVLQTNQYAKDLLVLLKAGLACPPPITDEEICQGLPPAHQLETDGPITIHDSVEGRHYIKSRLLWWTKVSGVITINDDRTIKDAIDPSNENAWFEVECRTNRGSHSFQVASDGDQYYAIYRVGGKRKIVEDLKISSKLDIGTMTVLDHRMLKETVYTYVKTLMDSNE